MNFWWIEYGGEKNIIEDAESIHDELLRVLFGVWDNMKNTGDHGVANYAITGISPFPSTPMKIAGVKPARLSDVSCW